MFNSLIPSLNIRSLPFVVFMGGFPSRLQKLSSGAIRPGGLLLMFTYERWVARGQILGTSREIKILCLRDISGNHTRLYQGLQSRIETDNIGSHGHASILSESNDDPKTGGQITKFPSGETGSDVRHTVAPKHVVAQN